MDAASPPLRTHSSGSTISRRGPEVESPDQDAAPGPRLLVNPDFEILLFPDGDSYELIQRLDSFAERASSEAAHRFQIKLDMKKNEPNILSGDETIWDKERGTVITLPLALNECREALFVFDENHPLIARTENFDIALVTETLSEQGE